MSNIALFPSFDRLVDDDSDLREQPIRAGLYNGLPYILVTATSSWRVPSHFNGGEVRVLLVGGGGAGGDHTKYNKRAGHMGMNGGNGGESYVSIGGILKVTARGGEHGTSAFTTSPIPTPPKGGGRGGFGHLPPRNGYRTLPNTLTEANTVLLASAAEGSAGKRLGEATLYDGVAGGGSAGYLPFQNLVPTLWTLPSHPDGGTANAGSPGVGFGAGGGGTAADSTLSEVGTSGGGHGKVADKTLSCSPGDLLHFQIGEGGKKNGTESKMRENGKKGVALIYVPNIISLLPQELPSPNVQNYRIAPTNYTVRTTMEYGQVRQRRLSLQNGFSLHCSWLFSEQQFFLFSSWFFHQIDNGSRAFIASIKTPYFPQKNRIVRFSQPFQAQLVSKDLWRVDAQLDFSENTPPNLIQQKSTPSP